MVDGLHLEDRLLARGRGVVAGPLAERSLEPLPIRVEEAFQGDLGVGRDRETSVAAGDALQRTPPHAANPIQLADARSHLEATGDEQQRVHAHHDNRRQRLASLETLVAVETAVLAGRDIEAALVSLMDHDSV